MNREDLFRFGFVSKLHGFKGEVVIASDKGCTATVREGNFIFIEINGQLIPFYIEEISQSASFSIVVKLEDVNDEKKAQRLKNCAVYLDAKNVRKSLDNDYELLVGFSVIDAIHGEIGSLSEVLKMPQQLLLTVKAGNKEILIPANEEIIQRIDKKKKIIFIEAPEGLVELYLGENGNR